MEGAPGKNSLDVTHWILWNIPASATSLPAAIAVGSSPMGIAQGKNVANMNGFQPPCPPVGATAHHYVFELYALDTPMLDLAAGSTRDQLLMAMNGHVIAKAAYVGLFARH
jgi:Raf kinase inhibitor-like YbhB/YbcL family protein